MPGAVTHFEIYAEEPAVLAEFYGEWLAARARASAGLLADRHRGWDAARLRRRGDLSSGRRRRSRVRLFHVRRLTMPSPTPSGSGRLCLRPRTAAPKTAWYAVLADPEGNIFAIYQKDPGAFGQPETDT